MTAVILAAGIGSRMQPITNSTPKCLVEIDGSTVINHQIRILHDKHIDNIVVVVGYLKEKIKRYLKDKVTYVENPIYRDSNSSYSLWLARKYIEGDFIYLNGDLLFSKGIMQKLLASNSENAIIIDRKIDINDDMFKAYMTGDQIVEMGKTLNAGKVNATVIGPAKFSNKGKQILFHVLNEYTRQGDKNQWCYTIFSKIARRINLKGVDITGLPWIEIDTVEDVKKAKKLSIIEGS